MKQGLHGIGPYKDFKSIIESLVTCIEGHSPFDKLGTLEDQIIIYLIPWEPRITKLNEYRVFVYQSKITAISQQSLYRINHELDDLSVQDRNLQIQQIVSIIYNYFENIIKYKINHINSYCIDMAVLSKDSSSLTNLTESIEYEAYFIEINPFGKEYSSGSSLFGWIQDEQILYDTNSSIIFRYTTGIIDNIDDTNL